MLRRSLRMRYDRQVIGYHACRKEVADRLLLDGEPFLPSRNDWDWLGSGVYFWEYGHQRAKDWAQQWPRLAGKDFGVVGAILQLGNCLDLLDTDHTRRLAAFARQLGETGVVLPANSGVKRLRDCALINAHCESIELEGVPVHTVRGLFQEGEPVTDGSAILLENHIQVVVRRPEAIVGLFRPRDFAAWSTRLASTPLAGQDEVDV